MKKITFTIIILFAALTVFGQNGLKNGDYFLLLNNNKTISLNTFENNTKKEIKTFPINKKSIYTTDQKTRVAILDTARNNVKLYNFQTSKEIKLSIPFDLKPKTILLNKNNLFIGGEIGNEMLVQYHIKSKKWYQLEIPTEVIFIGKAIDDLVVNDSLLIAIDNLIMPKYVLFYHLNPNDQLDLSHFKELKSNGPYESISQGRITENYFGLLSGTYSGYVGATGHITIYDNLNLKRSFAISSNERDKNYHTFTDFVIVGDKIVMAIKEMGLGILEIKDSYFKESKGKFDIFNYQININKINYRNYGGKEIIQLTKIPKTHKIVLTIKDEFENFKHEIIEI